MEQRLGIGLEGVDVEDHEVGAHAFAQGADPVLGPARPGRVPGAVPGNFLLALDLMISGVRQAADRAGA